MNVPNDLDIAVASLEEAMKFLFSDIVDGPNVGILLDRLRALRPDLMPEIIARWPESRTYFKTTADALTRCGVGVVCHPETWTSDGNTIGDTWWEINVR